MQSRFKPDRHGMLPVPVPVIDPAQALRPRAVLVSALRRVDGFGALAWRETYGRWRLRGLELAIEPCRPGAGEDEAACWAILGLPGFSDDADDAARASADFVLRQASSVLKRLCVRAETALPGRTVRATTACMAQERAHENHLVLRLRLWPPYAGMGLDAERMIRALRQFEDFAADLRAPAQQCALRRHVRCVAVQVALRAALPTYGLVAFLGDGALLARDAEDAPAPRGRALRAPAGAGVTIDLGRLGRFRGLGIRQGTTALIGAPYHGKSTLLHAIASGTSDHPPGDGRERVVTRTDAIVLQAEDGRRIKASDLSAFFPDLPRTSPVRGSGSGAGSLRAGSTSRAGSVARTSVAFSTQRASGATSVAAGLIQGIAAGARLLLIDEDAAAGNVLAIDPGMARLLGRSLAGVRTLSDLLPGLSAAGISTVLAVGARLPLVAAAEHILHLDRFAVRCVSRRRARLRAPQRSAPAQLPSRVLDDAADALFGPRHVLAIDVREPERPRVQLGRDEEHTVLDLRRAGFVLDADLVRGALLAAAWCCRLARPGETLGDLGQRYVAFAADARALDPFATTLIAVPPWTLVAAVLERLPRPLLRMHDAD